MAEVQEVKPYLRRIRDWKVYNIVILYLDARDQFLSYSQSLRKGDFASFEGLREISEMLFEIKEDHHLLYRRVLDPKKGKFEEAAKFTPDEVELALMNNIGLLFHKVMVARELKYVIEHYVETSESFQRNNDNLQGHIHRIEALFDEGIEILEALIKNNQDNVILVSALLEREKQVKRHFGHDLEALLAREKEGENSELLYGVGQYYSKLGRKKKARSMFKLVLSRNRDDKRAREALSRLDAV